MAQGALVRVSAETYLAHERENPERSEYLAGVIYAMAGGSLNHSRLVHALGRALANATDGSSCESFGSETKLRIDAADAYFYPDGMIVCGEVEVASEKDGIIKNPVIVFEVTSPGTERFDKSRKFFYFQSVPSLREYVLLSSDRKLVERFERQDDGSWRYTAYVGDVTVPISAAGIELSLLALYERLDGLS